MEHIEHTDTLEYYQRWTRYVWTNDIDLDDQLTHALFGLATEVGEVIDPFKKQRYTPHRDVVIDRDEMVKEIGDVLYYLTRVADMQGISMIEVIEANIDKLEKRYGKPTQAEGTADGGTSVSA